MFEIVGDICAVGWLWSALVVTQRPDTTFWWFAWCYSRNGLRYVAIAMQPVHWLQIRPIVHN